MKNTIQLEDGRRVVCKIYDNGGCSYDRYTAVLRAVRDRSRGRLYWPGLSMSERPFHPQGFGQHLCMDAPFAGPHLGKRVAFEDCPPDVQACILQEFAR